MNDNRAQLQKEQIKSWLEQQMQEKEAAEQDRRAADEAYKIAIIARDQRAIELDNMEKSCRKSLEQASIRFNLALVNRDDDAQRLYVFLYNVNFLIFRPMRNIEKLQQQINRRGMII